MKRDDAYPTFLNHPQAPLAEADVVFLPLPYDGTASYMKGTAEAPRAILAASDQLESYEEEFGWEPTEALRLHRLDPVRSRRNETPESYLARAARAAASIPPRAVAVGLGGEHSVSFPLAANCLAPGDTMVVFDAHPDLRDSFQGSQHSHGCISRRVHDDLGVDLIQIGLNCISAEEAAWASGAGRVEQFWARHLAERAEYDRCMKRLAGLKGRVYASVDVDGLSTAIMPGTGTPVAGGLEWHPFLGLLRALCTGGAAVVGFDVVEVRPLPDSPLSEFTAARILQKFLSYRFHR